MILDRSGSMSGKEQDAIGGFNGFVKSCRDANLANCFVTYVRFDDEVEGSGDEDRSMTERLVFADAADAARKALGEDQVRQQLVGVFIDLADWSVFVASVEESQEVAAILSVERTEAGCFGEGAQHVANPLGSIEPASVPNVTMPTMARKTLSATSRYGTPPAP